MAQIVVRQKVCAPVDQVFASWDSEFGDIYKFHAGLKESFIMDDSPSQSSIGTIRQCNMADGIAESRDDS